MGDILFATLGTMTFAYCLETGILLHKEIQRLYALPSVPQPTFWESIYDSLRDAVWWGVWWAWWRFVGEYDRKFRDLQ